MSHEQTATTYLTAIVYVPGEAYEFKKYIHNIKDTDHYRSKFCNDMKVKWPLAKWINFYYKNSRDFKEKIYLE